MNYCNPPIKEKSPAENLNLKLLEELERLWKRFQSSWNLEEVKNEHYKFNDIVHNR